MNKEYLYIGHYIDTEGNYILKVGTTNNLRRRQLEHTRNYRKTSVNTLSPQDSFCYDWTLSLSKWNTLRYEDAIKNKWQADNFGEYVRNDRFKFVEKPPSIMVKIRKEYHIML